MRDSRNKELLHGQALAMQWVGFAMQKIMEDVKVGGTKTQQLLGNAKTVGNNSGIETLSLGCSYVVNFVLPFTIELALKALLTKENVNSGNIHDLLDLYNNLPEQIKSNLDAQYQSLSANGTTSGSQSLLKNLLKEHRKDFVSWRYLENVENLKRDEKEMQFAICAILDIYNA